MAIEFKLPDIGEGVAEGEIVRWLVQEGAEVEEDQLLVEVMTDKATVEIPSPVAGTIVEIRAKEGATVPVGGVLVVIGEKGAARQAAGPSATVSGVKPLPADTAAASRPSRLEPRKAERASAPGAAAASRPSGVAPELAGGEDPTGFGAKVLATPATRRLARELGVDLATVPATGPRGRVTSDDVRQRAEERTSGTRAPPFPSRPAPAEGRPSVAPRATLPPSARGALEERLPVRGLRKRIAEAMRLSKHTAAHFSYVDECDVTELKALREGAHEIGQRRGVKITYMPFILKALVAGLRSYPYLNSTYDEARGEIVLKHYYNIGIAVDTEAGLIVPVVKDVERKSIFQIAQEIGELVERARQGKSRLDDLQDGTFTVTNAGNIGGLFATPIINYPEVAILGVNKIHQRPVVRGGEIVIRDCMYLSLSLDHRVVDGAMGARFMNELIRFIEDPKLLLLETV
ncbi:MAG: dihydrolipoamide acetyltransferase family protein [Planctomycetota bacterium]